MHATIAPPPQVLANFRALESATFVREKAGLGPGASPVGPIPFEKLNRWGGSLAVGHPFGATGTVRDRARAGVGGAREAEGQGRDGRRAWLGERLQEAEGRRVQREPPAETVATIEG